MMGNDKFHFSEGQLESLDMFEQTSGSLTEPDQWDGSFSAIPVRIFEELSRYLGEGEIYKTRNGGSDWQVQSLNFRHILTGYPASIGFRVWLNRNVFVLWGSALNVEFIDTVFEAEPLLKIIGGQGYPRVHGRGHGPNIIQAGLYNRLLDDMSLEHPAMKLIPLILWRAAQLAQGTNFQFDQYWEGVIDHKRLTD